MVPDTLGSKTLTPLDSGESRTPPSHCSATGLGGGAGLTLSLSVSAQDFSLRGLQ